MKLRSNFVFPFRSQRAGFSLVELLLSLAVLLVLTTLAVPIVVRSLQAYQLNSSASQLAGMLKFTKFEAIRENTPVSMQIVQQGTNWLVWVDSNGNGIPDGAEPHMIVGGSFTLMASGCGPSPSAIQTSLGGGSSFPWNVVSGSNGSIGYDQRGVISTLTVYVLYIGSSSVSPSPDCRAVITLPSGAVQVWTSTSTSWYRVS
ncbi:MAG TPA: GspH/FimT family protein [Candidatus Methylomirabilis sp.]|nr:GspH/FimT family protein [Candidatus Methylomirabilis sp.]